MTGTPISDVVHKGVMGGLLFDIMEDMGFHIRTLPNFHCYFTVGILI